MALKATYSIVVLFTIISCGQNTSERTSLSQKEVLSEVSSDSIIFKTSSDQYIYLGKRLYPSGDSDSISEPITKELVGLEIVGDTIFAFFNSEILYNQGNPKLPFVNDSLLKYYYPKYYDVKIDDDIPYFAYLKSSLDYAEFVREDNGEFYLEKATIRDTVLNVIGEVKIGLSKADVLTELGIPIDLVDKESFSLILCHADVPSKIWYKKDPEVKASLAPQKPTISVYLLFEDGKLQLAYYNFWIGFGDRRLEAAF